MSSKLARSNKNKGITLVELLIVIVVIGIIAAALAVIRINEDIDRIVVIGAE